MYSPLFQTNGQKWKVKTKEKDIERKKFKNLKKT